MYFVLFFVLLTWLVFQAFITEKNKLIKNIQNIMNKCSIQDTTLDVNKNVNIL